jgi:hypothetical protein
MENKNSQNISGEDSIIKQPSEAAAQPVTTTPDPVVNDNHIDKKQIPADKENRPLSLFQSLLLIIILAVPFLNIVFLIRWSFLKGINRNKKNIARAFLILIIFSLIFYYLGQNAIDSIRDWR